MSPYQLWCHSNIAAQNEDPIDLNDYGVDPNGPAPNGFDVPFVEVPDTRVPLSNTEMTVITNTIDPLQYSDSYGVDLYIGIPGVVLQMLSVAT